MNCIVKLACSSSITFCGAGEVEKLFFFFPLKKKALETELQSKCKKTGAIRYTSSSLFCSQLNLQPLSCSVTLVGKRWKGYI